MEYKCMCVGGDYVCISHYMKMYHRNRVTYAYVRFAQDYICVAKDCIDFVQEFRGFAQEYIGFA